MEKLNDGYLLTDDGYTISDLEMSGMEFSSPKRTEALTTILNGFGVSLQGNRELAVNCVPANFPIKKHNLIQAILAVNDMFMLSQPQVARLFLHDVELFLSKNDIRFTKNLKIAGKSGFDHTYDFIIPPSKSNPERLIKAINSISRDITESTIFAWNDTKQIRGVDATLYTFINDQEKRVSASCVEALKEYGIKPILWKQKDQYITDLAS